MSSSAFLFVSNDLSSIISISEFLLLFWNRSCSISPREMVLSVESAILFTNISITLLDNETVDTFWELLTAYASWFCLAFLLNLDLIALLLLTNESSLVESDDDERKGILLSVFISVDSWSNSFCFQHSNCSIIFKGLLSENKSGWKLCGPWCLYSKTNVNETESPFSAVGILEVLQHSKSEVKHVFISNNNDRLDLWDLASLGISMNLNSNNSTWLDRRQVRTLSSLEDWGFVRITKWRADRHCFSMLGKTPFSSHWLTLYTWIFLLRES